MLDIKWNHKTLHSLCGVLTCDGVLQVMVTLKTGKARTKRLAFRDDFFLTKGSGHVPVYKPGKENSLLKTNARPAFGAFYWWLVWSMMCDTSEFPPACTL